jgi:translation initiation factor 2-alpha kinase 4
VLTLKGQSYLREVTQFKIQKFLETQPRVFAKEAEVMVDKIVEGIRDILEDAAQAKASGKQLPSLEEERDRHEAALAKLAQEQQEKEKRIKEEEKKKEEKTAAEELQQELLRQKQKARESRVSRHTNGLSPHRPSTSSALETIDFDQYCSVTDNMGNPLAFRSVAGKSDPRAGPASTVFTVRPVLSNGQGNQPLALKEAVLRPNGKDQKEFKKLLQSLESRLQDLKTGNKIHHRHLVDVFDYKVESGTDADRTAANTWTVRILSPLAERGSLEELLELAGHLEIGKVRSWTRDLLDALNYLHNKNIAHQDIHPRNILLFRESTGEIVPKISDASYQREIHNLSSKKQGPLGLATAKSAYWLPPEIAAATKAQYTSKADIWDFGVVFVQMVFGLDVLRKYSSPKNLMESKLFSQPFQELVSRFFKDDRQKRPRAFELGASEFLATDAPVLFDDTSAMLSHTPSLNSLQAVPVRLRRDSMTNRSTTVSRYTEDFVEEGRLGKGGFGEVVKARKKLDGQIYAIKKITQRSQTSLTEILKEVRLLSQLSHPAVVRYYNTWVEEIPDSGDTEGETSTDDYTEDTRDTGAESAGIDIQFATSTGGLDFISSNAAVEFDYDSDEDEEDDEEHDSSDEEEDDDQSSVMDSVGNREKHYEKDKLAALQRRARMHRSYRTVLYISMEYCEKRVRITYSFVLSNYLL